MRKGSCLPHPHVMIECCMLYNTSISFNMARVFVGTGYNQVVCFHSADKTKKREVLGNLGRGAVRAISIDDANHRLLYATPQSIVAAYGSGEIQQVASIKGPENILKSEYINPHYYTRYCLSNGGVHTAEVPNLNEENESVKMQHETEFLGGKHNKFVSVAISRNRERYLFCGKDVVPVIANLSTGSFDWYGKNVKNDELDLQVPIKDVDAAFLSEQTSIAILHADRKLRIYDVRGTHRRPVKDILLPTTEKGQMTRMKISENGRGNYYFFSNDIGEVFQCDSRQEWRVVGKFKGITASVTDFELTSKALFAASLDSYVHMFDLNSTKLIKKYYINKPAYCLKVIADEREEEEESCEGKEEEMALDDVDEEEEQRKPQKLKQIRKRNKVGLKYLQPREFDEPTEIKVEEARNKEWYEDLNPIDRKEFQS